MSSLIHRSLVERMAAESLAQSAAQLVVKVIMARKAKDLSALEVARLSGRGHHAVGGVAGLYLYVTDSGARSWVLRIMIGDKRRHMGLGAHACSTNGSIIGRRIVAAPDGTPWTGESIQGGTDNAQRSQQASELP